MAQFLTNVNLSKNQLQNAVLHMLAADPGSGTEGQIYYNSASHVIRYFNGSVWIDLAQSVGGGTVDSIIQGAGISVSAVGNDYTVAHADTSTQTNIDTTTSQVIDTITFDTYGHVTGVTTRNMTLADIGYTGAANADNYGNWTATGDTGTTSIASGNSLNFEGGDGITTVASAGKVSAAVDSTVVRTTGDQSIAGNKTFSNNVVVNGNFTVTGATTSTISEVVNIEDSLIYLNSNLDGATAPTADAGIIIERGSAANVGLIWDEADDKFKTVYTAEVANDDDVTITSAAPLVTGTLEASTITATGTIAGALAAAGANAINIVTQQAASGVLTTRTAAQIRTDIGAGQGTVTSVNASGTNGITVSGGPITSSGTLAISVASASDTAAGVIEIATDAETIAGTDTQRAVTPLALAAMKHAASVGNGASTDFTISHALNTTDVFVEVFENATGSTVFADVTRLNATQVRVAFAVAPTANQFRVLIRK